VFCIRFRLPQYAFQISVHDEGKSLFVALVFKVEPCPLRLAIGWRSRSILYSLRHGHPTCRSNQNGVNTCMHKKKNFITLCSWKGNESIHYNTYMYRSQMYFFPLCSFNYELTSRDKFFINVKLTNVILSSRGCCTYSRLTCFSLLLSASRSERIFCSSIP